MNKEQTIHHMYACWTDGPKYSLLQTTSDIDLMSRAATDSNVIIGNPTELTKWIENFSKVIGTFYVDVDDETLSNMKELKPKLDIQQVDLG